ncbi:TetR/AcrR family transcriptional regulator [Streptomyces sp. NPDC050535]|uniref:TetR/AcrR family transcriptional regulator n=1 Tax=Streptomyces sp. NPDC050535 TaxID=3365626 RepID=UPI00378AC83E
MPPDKARPLRSDARENRNRLLEAAARAFARDGSEASLKAIAKDADVGIGTLYRRFPTRESLVEATYRNETAKLCDAADTLLAQETPAARALRSWMGRFADHMTTKHGMADALHAVLADGGELRTHSRHLLTGALARLVEAGVADRSIRPDADAEDVLMSLAGLTLIANKLDRPDRTHRLLNLLMDGLTYRSC